MTGQQVWPDKAILFCALTTCDAGCPTCGESGVVHDHVLRRFSRLPVDRKATWLHGDVPRYRCAGCRRSWRHPPTSIARSRTQPTRSADWWALSEMVLDHTPISGIVAVLGVSWDTAHTAVADVGTRVPIRHPGRLDGVEVVDIDEHAWQHTCKGDKYVTVIIDLTPPRDNTGPTRLLDLVEGRTKQAFKTWLKTRTDEFRAHVQIVAMKGLTGYKTTPADTVPDATTIMGSVQSGRVGPRQTQPDPTTRPT